jgi:hypothetical protein
LTIGGAKAGGAEGVAERASANSANVLNGLHSWLPSAWMRVWLFARRSAIHWRSCSTVTGPYGWPSAPMILYMT